MKFEVIEYDSLDLLRATISDVCQKEGHNQQVAYSTYHDALVQVCYACKKVRTTYYNPSNTDEPKSRYMSKLAMDNMIAEDVQGEESFDDKGDLFPDDEALADFLIQGSNEAEADAACFQEAYKRLYKNGLHGKSN